MSSARDSNWRPQPPNLQEFEKKEAAAMPVMVPVHSLGAEGRGGGPGARVGERGGTGFGSGEGVERGRARSRHRGGRPDGKTAAGAAGRQA